MQRNTILIIAGVLGIALIAYCILRKKSEGFQTFGATANHAQRYMNCLSDCEKQPGWKTLNPGSGGGVLCSNKCDDEVSKMVRCGIPPQPVETARSRTFKRCGVYEENPECHRKSMCFENVARWCKDECAFGVSEKKDGCMKCMKMCIASNSPSCSFGSWTV